MNAENSKINKKIQKKFTPNDIFDFILFFLLIAPIIYGILFITLSSPINKHWNTTMECTIKDSGILKSGSKSYSSSEDVIFFTEECGDQPFEYAGTQKMSNEDFAAKVNELVGQKVKIKVGNWQLFMSLQRVYYIEGATPE
ncbi:hypothetical protein [Rothia nasimurium]|nr:hypothetical protein [Rothia nasimurium]